MRGWGLLLQGGRGGHTHAGEELDWHHLDVTSVSGCGLLLRKEKKKTNQKLKSIFIENFVICFITVFIDAHFLQLRFATFFICTSYPDRS